MKSFFASASVSASASASAESAPAPAPAPPTPEPAPAPAAEAAPEPASEPTSEPTSEPASEPTLAQEPSPGLLRGGGAEACTPGGPGRRLPQRRPPIDGAGWAIGRPNRAKTSTHIRPVLKKIACGALQTKNQLQNNRQRLLVWRHQASN